MKEDKLITITDVVGPADIRQHLCKLGDRELFFSLKINKYIVAGRYTAKINPFWWESTQRTSNDVMLELDVDADNWVERANLYVLLSNCPVWLWHLAL